MHFLRGDGMHSLARRACIGMFSSADRQLKVTKVIFHLAFFPLHFAFFSWVASQVRIEESCGLLGACPVCGFSESTRWFGSARLAGSNGPHTGPFLKTSNTTRRSRESRRFARTLESRSTS